MPHTPTSYLSDKCEVRTTFGNQLGVYAIQPIKKGELVAMFGGTFYLGNAIEDVPDDVLHLGVQMEEDIYLVPQEGGPAHRINHSCDPNLGFNGQIAVVAMRDIAVGEQVSFDYAMCDGTPYDEFDCLCEGEHCRHHVTGDDWKRPELHERYKGYFSPYLQRRIDAMKK